MVIIAPEERLLTISDAARMLSVHPNTIRRWNDRGIIRAYRIGSRGDRRFAFAEVRALLRQLESGGNLTGYKTTTSK